MRYAATGLKVDMQGVRRALPRNEASVNVSLCLIRARRLRSTEFTLSAQPNSSRIAAERLTVCSPDIHVANIGCDSQRSAFGVDEPVF